MKRARFGWGVVTLLSVLGFVGNTLALSGSSSSSISFMFGSVAVLLAAGMYGPTSGLLTGLVVALPTVGVWGHPWALLIPGLEGLVCGFCIARFGADKEGGFGLSLTVANLLFWIILGIPLGYAIYGYALAMPSTLVNLIVAKWAMNGVLNAALAEFLLSLLIAPNLGGWLRVHGAHIARWQIRDMYVASIVVTTVSIVLMGVVTESRQHLDVQYNAQRSHQETTLALLNQLLPLSKLTELSPQQQAALQSTLQSSTPQYALSVNGAETNWEFGEFPTNIGTEGPAFEVTQTSSTFSADIMHQWLGVYMVTRSVNRESQSTLVLVSALEPLYEGLWQTTVDGLVTSAIAVFVIVLWGLAFSRYATRSLTQLAKTSASIGAQPHDSERLYREIGVGEGFEPKEVHDVRRAISRVLREEARAYQAALSAAADYQKIIEDANAPIVSINMAGAIIGWNRAAEVATGLDRQRVIGRKTEQVLIESIPAVDTNRIITRLRKGGTLDGMRLSFKNTDGRRVTLLLSGVVLNDIEGEPDRLIMVGQNLTDYLEQEQQLLQASKMSTLGEMATGMAHELNQPLNAMRLSIANIRSSIQRKPAQIEPVVDKLARMDTQIDRATKIIDHLRLYGRKSNGLSALTLEKFDPGDAIRNGLSLFHEQFRIANINLRCDIAANNGQVLGDSMLFEQVLVNLLSNARDAISGHNSTVQAEVRVTTAQQGDQFSLVVEDTGGGVESHILTQLFEPFYTSKAPGQGTGLGLSIAYSTISSMGGSIVASNGIHGLRVTVTLPTAG